MKYRGSTKAAVRTIPDHACDLPLEDEPANYRIYRGIFVEFRRRLWKCITIDPSSPQSKRILKSAAEIHEEEVRHLDRYPSIIHPFSRFRYMWEMFMIPVWLTIFLMIPVSMSRPTLIQATLYFYAVFIVICNVDIVLWFFTGYYDKARQVVQLKLTRVAKHYIRTYFFFDLISSQPISWYIYIFDIKEYHFLTTLLLLKMVRLPTLFRYMCQVGERKNISTSNIKFVCFTLGVCIMMSWTSSVVFMVIKLLFPRRILWRELEDVPMLMTVFRVTRALMTVGVTEEVNISKIVMLFEIIVITMGSILEVVILAKVMQVYQKHSSSRNKYNNLLEEINEYMKYKELPARLKEKILRYVDFKFQKHIFREEDVLNNLSSVLKHDILMERCQNMVEKVDFFKDLPSHVIVRIVTRLRSEIFLPSDVIVLAGYPGHAMYFIYMGTVAVYTGNGKEICHLDDGGHFGEIALIINEPRVATVIAVKECELFKLSRKDFQEAIEPFPEISKKIRSLGLRRLESTLQMMSQDREDDITPQTSLSDTDIGSVKLE